MDLLVVDEVPKDSVVDFIQLSEIIRVYIYGLNPFKFISNLSEALFALLH